MSRACGSGWPAAKSLRGDALIGADGLWSRIREAVVGDGKPRVSGHIAYRAVLKREDVPAHLWSDDVLLWGGEKTHLVHYPLRRGELFNLVAVFHSDKYDEGWNTFGDTGRAERALRPCRAAGARAAGQDRNLEDVGAVRSRAGEELERPAASRCWATRPTPCCSTWRRARARRSKTPWCWARRCAPPRGDPAQAFQKYQQARYLRTGRVQLTARFYGDIYHASGVQRELRNQLFQSGKESAGFAGLKWMYDGIDPDNLFH